MASVRDPEDSDGSTRCNPSPAGIHQNPEALVTPSPVLGDYIECVKSCKDIFGDSSNEALIACINGCAKVNSVL